MSTRSRNARSNGKKSSSANEITKKKTTTTTTTRKSPRKPPAKAKISQQSDEEDENITSSYFKEDYDSDALDEDSDVGKKRRKPSAAKTKKTSPRKKRKLEDEEEYDESGEDHSTEKKVYDSDALDDESDEDSSKRKKKGRTSISTSPKKTQSARKKQKKQAEESEPEFEDLQDGQKIVGVVVQAPTTGRVPPGQISQNTIDFLTKLKDPACNDREWFKLHEPVYRLAEKEWKDFVEAFTDVLTEVDPQIPQLPPKDVIHRIYRDIRFSNDKTPYKAGFSASFSRSGRKGIFAHYHIGVQPGNQSMIAAGSWCPGRNELASIRANIQRNPRRLRAVISDPDFVKFFGAPKPHPKGSRQNIFGGEDELKTAPKGVAKDHKDIDLLKCRSFAVVHRFADSEVLDPDFKHSLAKVAKVMQSFVHCLNDMTTIMDNTNDDDEEEEGGADSEE